MTNSKNTIISILRFPMAALVVLLHANIVYSPDVPLRYDGGLANTMIILFSNGICQVAVPTFALISGYLFFGGLQCFSMSIWFEKVKRRFTSLFVPYVLWNIIAFLWMLFYCYLLHSFREAEFDISKIYNSVGGVRMFWNGWCNLPIDGPLWYLKNLIIIVLMSPLIYILVRYTRIVGVVALGILYIFDIWPSWHWLLVRVIFFFTLGAYYRIKEEELFVGISRFRFFIYSIAVVSLLVLLLTFNIHPEYSSIVHHVFTIFGVISAFFFAQKLVQCKGMYSLFCTLGTSSFFVYAAHRFAIIDIIKNVVIVLIPTNSDLGVLSVYLIVAIVTFTICHCLFLAMRVLCPNILSFLIGGR